MTNIEVKSTVTLKINSHSFELTKQEARKLLNDLRNELENTEPVKQGLSIFDLDKYPKFGVGDQVSLLNDKLKVGPIVAGIAPGQFGDAIAYQNGLKPEGTDKAKFLDRRTGSRALNVPFEGTVAC